MLPDSDSDAFGHALMDHFKGKETYEILERDDGFFDSADIGKIYFSEYRNWTAQTRQALRYARGKVLDIGCGAGRHSLYLQSKGLDVLGVDISPLAIKVSKLRGLKRAHVVSITQLSFREKSFDTILMMGNNFGLLGNSKRAKWLLSRFYKMTSDNGIMIAQALDPYKTNDPAHKDYHEFNRKRGRPGGQLRLRVRYRNYKTPWFDYLFVSQEEMNSILEGSGWKTSKFIQSKLSPGYIALIEKGRPSDEANESRVFRCQQIDIST
jgi:SAM-dependent methyltransferase